MSKVAYPLGPHPFLNFLGNHEVVTPGPQRIGVDLTTVMLMYWRVAQWQVTLTVSGAFSASQGNGVDATLSVDNATFTAVYAPQFNGQQITDETQLVLPCDTSYQVSQHADPGTVTATYPYGSGSQPYALSDGPIFAPFAGPGNYPGANGRSDFVDYDPSSGLYSPIYDAIFNDAVVGERDSVGLLSLIPQSSLTKPYAGNLMVPITVSGIGTTISLTLAVSAAASSAYGSTTITTPISASIQVVPSLWWSYGGKYDTATGAKL